MALTARGVAAAKEPGLYGDGGGLYLAVSRGGSKSWILRFQLAGKRRDMGLGSVELVSLAEARQAALEARKLVKAGTDPIEAKRSSDAAGRPRALTFEAVAAEYIEEHRAGWRNAKHAAQWTATLATYVFPIFGAVPVDQVDVGVVTRALRPIWTEKPET